MQLLNRIIDKKYTRLLSTHYKKKTYKNFSRYKYFYDIFP